MPGLLSDVTLFKEFVKNFGYTLRSIPTLFECDTKDIYINKDPMENSIEFVKNFNWSNNKIVTPKLFCNNMRGPYNVRFKVIGKKYFDNKFNFDSLIISAVSILAIKKLEIISLNDLLSELRVYISCDVHECYVEIDELVNKIISGVSMSGTIGNIVTHYILSKLLLISGDSYFKNVTILYANGGDIVITAELGDYYYVFLNTIM